MGIKTKSVSIKFIVVEICFSIFTIILSFILLTKTVGGDKTNLEYALGEYFVHWQNAFTAMISLIFLVFRSFMGLANGREN